MADSMRSDARLGTEKLSTLMLSLSLPSILAQVVNLLYSIVDRMYIGHIPGVGTLALTGLGVCTPIILLVSAFAAFVGMGGAPLAAIELGRGNRDGAERILGCGAGLLLGFAAVLTAGFLAFKGPLLLLFGASADTLPYAEDYLTTYLCGTVFVMLALGLNQFISAQGEARVAMLSTLIGAVANVALDPVFIFALNMGVRGAALATIISQGLSAVWVVGFLASRRSGIRLSPALMRPRPRTALKIASLGVSPFIMQATESLIVTVFNLQLRKYGDDIYVGSMTILQSVMQMIFVPAHGFTYGVQPIISYNFGAGNSERVRRCVFVSVLVCVGYASLVCLACTLFPRSAAMIFTREEELVALVGRVLPIYLGGMWVFGIQTSVQSAFLGLGAAKISLLLAVLRKIILLTPLALLLPLRFGVMGVYWAEPISDTLSALTAGAAFLLSYKKLISRGPGGIER